MTSNAIGGLPLRRRYLYHQCIMWFEEYRQKKRNRAFGWVSFAVTLISLVSLFGFAFATRTNTTSVVPGEARFLTQRGAHERVKAAAGMVPAWKLVVPAPAASRAELIDQLYRITEVAPGTYGVYVYELDTGEGFGINADTRFEAASTNKVPVLMKLYQEIEAGGVSRDQALTYLWADFEEGTGSIQAAAVGSQWTVAQLAERMMKESDNVAKNMLLRLLGYAAVEELTRGLGSDFDIYYNLATPRGMANLLRLIYENEVVGPELSREMIELMIETDFEDRLPRYLDDVDVANKIGTWGDSVSDVGIVLHRQRPFVICVYSSGTGSEAEAADAIALIAANVYAYEMNR